jgi:hypothetical protein
MKQINLFQLALCFSPTSEPDAAESEVEYWIKARRLIFMRCLSHWDQPKPEEHRRNHERWLQRRVYELGGLEAVW